MHEPNRDVVLEKSPITFTTNGKSVNVKAKLLLRLLPKPSFVIEIDDLPLDVTMELGKPYHVSLENGNEIEASCISWIFHSSESGTTSKCVLKPQGGCTLLQSDNPLQSVEFSLLNFPKFNGRQDEVLKTVDGNEVKRRRNGTVLLASAPWEISISALPELDEYEKKLNAEGGYAITHKGRLTRSDGKTFSAKEAEDVLTHTLRLFLSFARGAFCAIVGIVGRDYNGNEAWKLSGSPIVDPWSTGRQSWFDTMHGHVLTEVFEGFYAKLNDTNMGEKIERGLHWYLLGNRGTGFSDADTVLVQAALEYISHVQSSRIGRGSTASESIKNALDDFGICADVPESCQKLKRFVEEHNELKHGPHALTELRNDMIHAQQKYGIVPSGVYFEAKNLGLWYVEMMLLREFGYNGLYGNRLKVGRWVGEVEPVPWAQDRE